MQALTAGTSAPDFSLPSLTGEQFSLSKALEHGPVLLAFFKISCPVCQYTFPFLERIYQSRGGRNITVVGVSQNESQETAQFIKQYGVSFPTLLDDTKTYPVSNSYGLSTVPTIFWIGRDGTIEISSVGWVRSEIEQIYAKVRDEAQHPKPLFAPGEKIADFRAG